MTYKIGMILFCDTEQDQQIYKNVAEWCNENHRMIVEIESKNGQRRFQIQSVSETSSEYTR